MYALVVLALCIDDIDSLLLADKDAAVAYLAAHLAIERCRVEDKLIVCLLLLCHLAVAEDVAVVLCVVISDKLLLAFRDYLPVSVLHGGGIACACLLLLHLHGEALLVDSISILTADELCEVKGESVSVE